MNDFQNRMLSILFRVKVSGESMWPELVPGTTYWASSLLRYGIGSIVIATTTSDPPFIIKKITQIQGDTVTLQGTVSWSASFVVPRKAILGRVVTFHLSLAP